MLKTLVWNMFGDRVEWNGCKNEGMLIAEEIYDNLFLQMPQNLFTGSYRGIWENKTPLKMELFLWLVRMDKNLAWANLNQRGIIGPAICRLCMEEGEDNTHLFYKCKFAKNVLMLICEHFKMQGPITENIEVFINWWNKKSLNYRNIPGLFHWEIWCDRNNWIFREKQCWPKGTAIFILQNWGRLRTEQKPPRDLSMRMRPIEIKYPAGFFDGASQLSSCGCGAWMMFSPNCHYKIH